MCLQGSRAGERSEAPSVRVATLGVNWQRAQAMSCCRTRSKVSGLEARGEGGGADTAGAHQWGWGVPRGAVNRAPKGLSSNHLKQVVTTHRNKYCQQRFSRAAHPHMLVSERGGREPGSRHPPGKETRTRVAAMGAALACLQTIRLPCREYKRVVWLVRSLSGAPGSLRGNREEHGG